MTRWISISEQLPPNDGLYEVTNHPHIHDDTFKQSLSGLAEYDGYGFKYLGIYRTPLYWRPPICLQEKKYGKIIHNA